MGGGGRFDGLIGRFSGVDVPATGMSIGLDRLYVALQTLGLFEAVRRTVADVMVAHYDETTQKEECRVAARLRRAGVRVVLYNGRAKFRGQFGYASQKGIRYVIVVGPEEIQQGVVSLRDMETRQQRYVAADALVDEVKKLLG